MAERASLLELKLGDSGLVLQGPQVNLGPYETSLLVAGTAAGFELRIRGQEHDVGQGSVVLNRPLLWENTTYDIYIRGPAPRFLATSLGTGSARERFRTDSFTHYALNYRSSVGDVAWTWRTPLGEIVLRMEVFPTKLDYRRDFQAIKSDLRRLSALLLADIRGATGAPFIARQQPQEVQVEWIEQLRRETERLSAAMRTLLPRLRKQVTTTAEAVPVDRIRGKRLLSRRSASQLAAGQRPRRVLVRKGALTESTPINGHLRWEVDRLLLIGRRVRQADWLEELAPELGDLVNRTVDEAEGWRRRLSHIPAVPNLPHLQTRLRDPFYARAFTSLRRLYFGLEENQSPELLGLKDLALLYEYWVFLQVVERLRVLFPQVLATSASLVREVGGQLRLVRGVESRIVLSDGAGQIATCYYDRAFSGLPTTNQKPDVMIELPPPHGTLIVDAKYRLGRSPRYLEKYGMAGPEEDDINVLHRYRDAIVDIHGLPVVRSGLIAFPGQDEDQYREHHFYRSWDKAGIAGVPLLPGMTALLDELLSQMLATSSA